MENILMILAATALCILLIVAVSLIIARMHEAQELKRNLELLQRKRELGLIESAVEPMQLVPPKQILNPTSDFETHPPKMHSWRDE